MKTVESEAVRIGGQWGRGIITSLEVFLNVFSKVEFKGKSLNEIKNAVSENYAYVNADEFFRDQVAHGYDAFDSIGLEEAQMAKFDQLAKQYGMKYHFEQKPDNISSLLKSTDLSKEDEAILDVWTRNIDGERVEISDDFKITFAMKDMPKMECIVKDLRDYVNRNLDERIQKATEADMDTQTKKRTKQKEHQQEHSGR